ncbi:hypothetical protein E4T47_05376 [Aureobasidium subglaciale]|nr:hypothetical protein E4T43_01744 [Aureobasidium subglaciale]KAI5271310.1 hypothetical protein E4T47_05376 [Aureobasidium subglaciale]
MGGLQFLCAEDARVQRAVIHLLHAFAGLFKALTCYVLYHIFRTMVVDMGKLFGHKSSARVALEEQHNRPNASNAHAYGANPSD